MDAPVFKTSNEWYEELYPTHEFVIYDPDGWDRTHFNYSYFTERITLTEFNNRVLRSTCLRIPKGSDKPVENDSPTVDTINTIMATHSGFKIDLAAPNVGNMPLSDIAHGLSHICRWGGVPENFFSVAEHCVMAAELAPPKDRLQVLMHDCEEAILGDNITPLKYLIPQLVVVGDQIRDLILARFRIRYDHNVIKVYDKQQFEWEYENIIESTTYVGLSPRRAKALFINKFNEYSKYLKS